MIKTLITTTEDREKRRALIPAAIRSMALPELTERLREMGTEPFCNDSLPVEVQEDFLRGILTFHTTPTIPLREALAEEGITVPPPGEVLSGELAARIREIVGGMARLRTYLIHTDHLSDEELYEELWEMCEEPFRPGLAGLCQVDLIGWETPQGAVDFLRFYATEEERRAWAEDGWADLMPRVAKPPYDRDRTLPHPGGLVAMPAAVS